MDSSIQDWKTVVIRKPKKEKTVPQISKPASSIKTTYTEDGQEISKLKIVSQETAQFIIKTRLEKNLKQSDLAKKASMDVKTIADIERGGCVYNAEAINKIGKALGVNIPRK